MAERSENVGAAPPANGGRPPSARTDVRRHPERGRYDRELIHAILDEAPICHVGFVVDGQPFVIPTIHARVGDTLYLHGSPASRMLRTIADGVPVCVTATLLDGVVFARSAFNSSMNYRSAVVLGKARRVEDPEEQRRGFGALVEHVAAKRSGEARMPSDDELRKTLLLRLPIEEASAKVRAGPPKDDPDDLGLPIWAGVLPLALVAGEPDPDPALDPALPVPPSVRGYRRPGRS
jgi:nitroimidazol reductase NimA-like FMN-containing flavoprotein (pyridoxamine 5'-phosphate oxidase superfamily)